MRRSRKAKSMVPVLSTAALTLDTRTKWFFQDRGGVARMYHYTNE